MPSASIRPETHSSGMQQRKFQSRCQIAAHHGASRWVLPADIRGPCLRPAYGQRCRQILRRARAPRARNQETAFPRLRRSSAMPRRWQREYARVGTTTNPVDLNSRTKQQLLTLWGLTAAQADRIIAGRPYSEPGELVTRGIRKRSATEFLTGSRPGEEAVER